MAVAVQRMDQLDAIEAAVVRLGGTRGWRTKLMQWLYGKVQRRGPGCTRCCRHFAHGCLAGLPCLLWPAFALITQGQLTRSPCPPASLPCPVCPPAGEPGSHAVEMCWHGCELSPRDQVRLLRTQRHSLGRLHPRGSPLGTSPQLLSVHEADQLPAAAPFSVSCCATRCYVSSPHVAPLQAASWWRAGMSWSATGSQHRRRERSSVC